MLVLSRKRGEKITIGSDIELVVVEVRSDKVRVGITAPKSVPIYRQELLPLRPEKAQEAATIQPPGVEATDWATVTKAPERF